MRATPLIALLLGCTPDPGDTTEEPGPGPEGCILTQDDMDFGDRSLGEPSASPLLVANPCQGVLDVLGATLHGEAFSLGDPGPPLEIPAGGEVLLEVIFAPPHPGAFEADLELLTSDPDRPTSTITLSGQGHGPVVDVRPAALNVGDHVIGCEATLDFAVGNLGDAPLLVHDVSLVPEPPELTLEWLERSRVVPPGEELALRLRYAPLDDLADDATVRVSSTDPVTPLLEVPASAAGEVEQWVEHSIVQERPVVVDVLLTFDRSISSSRKHWYEDNLPKLVEGMTADPDADYQLAAVIQDDGCVLGWDDWIDPGFSAEEAAAALWTMIDLDFDLYPDGDNEERGFALAEAALSPDNLGSRGCNEGLVREDARLEIVHISDEDDQSDQPPSFYVSLFTGMKADPSRVRMHAVAGSSICGDPGPGYLTATTATGGWYLDLCSSAWGTSLARLAAPDVASYSVDPPAVPETLIVRVDEVLAEGWTWDEIHSAVVFDEDHVPRNGATVDIAYHALPLECGD